MLKAGIANFVKISTPAGVGFYLQVWSKVKKIIISLIINIRFVGDGEVSSFQEAESMERSIARPVIRP